MVVMIIGAGLSLAVLLNVFVFVKLVRAFHALAIRRPVQEMADLPTVTICIAARNETHAMTQCLERVVASEYPKLEVIVLDDGSRDDTSILIKSFAHAGVRFVEGQPLPNGWLGKNYAQLLLAREASGSVVFFMDVDTLIERHTVARSVEVMKSNSVSMLSIVPQRSSTWQSGSFFTTMRHFWILMRHSSTRPRATSNAWLIDRDMLLQEFATDPTLAQSMKVETAIAGKHPSVYQLIMSNAWIGVRYEKRWSSQVETSIRILYLQCRRHWYEVAGLIVLLLVALFPYGALAYTPWAWAVIALQYITALYYTHHIWPRYQFVGALSLPFTLAQEIVLLIISAYRYNFGTITWKGRPVSSVTSENSPAK